MLDIPDSEFNRRIEGFRAWLRDHGVDAAVITRPENIYYLSNFRAASIAAWTSRVHALVVPADRPPQLLARALEVESANLQWTADPLLWRDHEDPYRLLAGAVQGPGQADRPLRIGIEKASLTVAQLRDLSAVLPAAEFVDCGGVVERIAAALAEPEIGCMRAAASVAQVGMDVALGQVAVGRYPYQAIGAIHEAMYAAGQSDFEKSFVAVWSGPRGGMMHDTRATQRFADGDIATIEIMGVDHQYLACVQTCVVLGAQQPSPEVREAYAMVVAMFNAAREAVKAGVTAGDVFAAANAIYRARTGQDYFRRVGGSIGLTLFALDLVKDSEEQIRAGTPLLVQTLVTEPVLLTCAGTILVTDDGHEKLTEPLLWDGALDGVGRHA